MEQVIEQLSGCSPASLCVLALSRASTAIVHHVCVHVYMYVASMCAK